MKLFLISQDTNDCYDTYDSAVVAAVTVKQARFTSPDNYRVWDFVEKSWMFQYASGRVTLEEDHHSWVNDPKNQVTVKTLGTAKPNTKSGVICASFNAG